MGNITEYENNAGCKSQMKFMLPEQASKMFTKFNEQKHFYFFKASESGKMLISLN